MGLISRVSSRTYRKPPTTANLPTTMPAKGGAAKVGGMRRKQAAKKPRSADASDDKKIQATLKKFSCSNLPGIDEVNMFKEDGNVIHFKNPKVTASPTSNTFTISGNN